MGLATFSIYKYVRTSKRWRYCKPIYGKNNKLKPDAVLVDGKEELHTEGAYYLNADGQWEKVGTSAATAQDEQRRRLARQRYEKDTGGRRGSSRKVGGTRRATARCQPAPSSSIRQHSPGKSAEVCARNTDIASASTQGSTSAENLPS